MTPFPKSSADDVLVADWENGKLVGYMYIPAGQVLDTLHAEGAATSVGQYTKPCDLKCGLTVGSAVATGLSLGFGGLAIGAGALEVDAVEEGALAGAYGRISLVTGAIGVGLNPTYSGATLVGIDATVQMIPLPEIRLPVDIVLQSAAWFDQLNAH